MSSTSSAGVQHFQIPSYWNTAPVFIDNFYNALSLCKSIGVTDLTKKENVRTAFLALFEKEDKMLSFTIFLYFDTLSNHFGLDYFSPGFARGWEHGIGKYLKDGMNETQLKLISPPV